MQIQIKHLNNVQHNHNNQLSVRKLTMISVNPPLTHQLHSKHRTRLTISINARLTHLSPIPTQQTKLTNKETKHNRRKLTSSNPPPAKSTSLNENLLFSQPHSALSINSHQSNSTSNAPISVIKHTLHYHRTSNSAITCTRMPTQLNAETPATSKIRLKQQKLRTTPTPSSIKIIAPQPYPPLNSLNTLSCILFSRQNFQYVMDNPPPRQLANPPQSPVTISHNPKWFTNQENKYPLSMCISNPATALIIPASKGVFHDTYWLTNPPYPPTTQHEPNNPTKTKSNHYIRSQTNTPPTNYKKQTPLYARKYRTLCKYKSTGKKPHGLNHHSKYTCKKKLTLQRTINEHNTMPKYRLPKQSKHIHNQPKISSTDKSGMRTHHNSSTHSLPLSANHFTLRAAPTQNPSTPEITANTYQKHHLRNHSKQQAYNLLPHSNTHYCTQSSRKPLPKIMFEQPAYQSTPSQPKTQHLNMGLHTPTLKNLAKCTPAVHQDTVNLRNHLYSLEGLSHHQSVGNCIVLRSIIKTPRYVIKSNVQPKNPGTPKSLSKLNASHPLSTSTQTCNNKLASHNKSKWQLHPTQQNNVESTHTCTSTQNHKHLQVRVNACHIGAPKRLSTKCKLTAKQLILYYSFIATMASFTHTKTKSPPYGRLKAIRTSVPRGLISFQEILKLQTVQSYLDHLTPPTPTSKPQARRKANILLQNPETSKQVQSKPQPKRQKAVERSVNIHNRKHSKLRTNRNHSNDSVSNQQSLPKISQLKPTPHPKISRNCKPQANISVRLESACITAHSQQATNPSSKTRRIVSFPNQPLQPPHKIPNLITTNPLITT
eukprot:gene3390-2344_t